LPTPLPSRHCNHRLLLVAVVYMLVVAFVVAVIVELL
jgi:hypothetical protein